MPVLECKTEVTVTVSVQKTNQNTQEVKIWTLLVKTGQNKVHVFGNIIFLFKTKQQTELLLTKTVILQETENLLLLLVLTDLKMLCSQALAEIDCICF